MTGPDRQMARDLALELRRLANAVAGYQVPRWLMIVVAPSIAQVARIVADYQRRQDEQRAAPLPPVRGCEGKHA